VKSAERELRCPRACLSNRDDLPVSRPNRFDRPVLARCLRIDKLDVVLHPDSGGVAHLERDLPGVFRLLQAVAAEAVPERVALLFHTGHSGHFRHALARIGFEDRVALPARANQHEQPIPPLFTIFICRVSACD
jgi:hypothetical protein